MKSKEETRAKAKELGIKSSHLYSEENLLLKIAEIGKPTEEAEKAIELAGIEIPKEVYKYKVLNGKVRVMSIREKPFLKGDIIESPIKLPKNFEIELVK